MSIRFFRFVGTTTVLLAGLTTAPTRAADATLPGRGLIVNVAAVSNGPAIERRKVIAVSDLPNERRSVVLVYQDDAAPASGSFSRP